MSAPGAGSFWSEFDYQHATFSDSARPPDRGGKNFMPHGSTSVHLGGGDLVVNVKNTSAAGGGAAKLAYGVSLFLNRLAITEAVKSDVKNRFGNRIRQIAPPAGQGGVLVSYSVLSSTTPDGMGKTVGSYGHECALLGAGTRSTEPYNRAMSGPATIGMPREAAGRQPSAAQEKTICYLWVFRKS